MSGSEPPDSDDDVPVAEPLDSVSDAEWDDSVDADQDEMPTLADFEVVPGPVVDIPSGNRTPVAPVAPVAPGGSRAPGAGPTLSSWPASLGGAPAVGVGKYQHGSEIGRGGMGAIYRVKDTVLKRDLAMKVLLHQKATDTRRATSESSEPDLLERFLEEAQVTAQLDHPGVVPVHELGVDGGGNAYFTMNLVRGETLSKVFAWARTNSEGWNLARALNALHRVCETMAFAHAKGVIHRDLKPANVMVGKFGEVYVMDWGLAKVRGNSGPDDGERQDVQTVRSGDSVDAKPLETLAGRVVGTPAYMPPEQAEGRLSAVDSRSDVYSIGAMLYQLLAGHPPYMPEGSKAGAMQLLMDVIKGPPAPLSEAAPEAPPELVSIAEKAMARDPAARYRDATEMGDDLQRFLSGHVVRAYKSGALIELRKWIQRNRAVAATAAVASVVLAVLTVVFLLSLKSERDEAQHQRDEASAQRDEAGRQRDEAARQRDEANRQRDRAVSAEQLSTQRAEEAEREREAKSRALDNVFRLADNKRLADLRNEAETLWPVHPDSVPRMDAWIGQARALVANLKTHRETLEAIRRDALPYTDAERTADFAPDRAEIERLRASAAAEQDLDERDRITAQIADIEATLGTRRTWRFASEQLAWQHSVLADLVAGIEDLAAEDTGLLARITRRRQESATLRGRSIGDHQKLWDTAIEDIADRARSPRYGGLVITPQLGLVPLGKDPASGLYEFAHIASGPAATRSAETGQLEIAPKTGIVFVLVPAVTYWMGAQSGADGGSNYDPEARAEEGPVHEVTLAPHFLSKYECTQGQWWQMTGGSVPSTYKPGNVVAGEMITWRNPVELVTWEECDRWLARYDLTLPTEAQWEHACRAGTQTRWSGADEPIKLEANVADGFLLRNGGPPEWAYTPEIQDGHAVHAPVGSYPANALGFHDLHGNVWEWCLDRFGPYSPLPATDPAGPREGVDRVKRGGGWDSTAFLARSAYRDHLEPNVRTQSTGCRAARPVRDE